MTAAVYGVAWQGLPYQPVPRAAAIAGCSTSQIYSLINSKKLRAVKLAGTTLVTTASIVEFLTQAQPWSPDHARIGSAKHRRRSRARAGDDQSAA